MLNSRQCKLIRNSCKVLVDELIQKGYAGKLRELISPPKIESPDLVTYLTLKLVAWIICDTEIPDNHQAHWKTIYHNISTRSQLDTNAINALRDNPNFNPYNIADIESLRRALGDVDPVTRDAMLRLRETYLEMTPMGEYEYNPGHPFHYRLGAYPFNLNRFGEIPKHGEIREAVEDYVNERIELHDEYTQQTDTAPAPNLGLPPAAVQAPTSARSDVFVEAPTQASVSTN